MYSFVETLQYVIVNLSLTVIYPASVSINVLLSSYLVSISKYTIVPLELKAADVNVGLM